METDNIVDFASRDGISDALTDLLRTGAQQLIATAVEAELEGFLAQFAEARTVAGHAVARQSGCEERVNQDENPWSRHLGRCRPFLSRSRVLCF